MNQNLLPTGQIVNTHGLRGHVKVMPWADSPEDLLDFDRFFIGGKEYAVEHSSLQKSMVLLKLEGVDDIDAAALLRNNSEERQYLEGRVDEGTIGSLSISCVYIELLESGAGLSVSCQNISWCTVAIYENALVTAGITDAKVIIAAPFSVSGTAALSGIYKAYETMTGTTLDEEQKDVAVEEMITTGQLAEAIGSADATELVNQLKAILDETANMTDDELREQILAIAAEIGVTLTEDQIAQLITLVRQMERLDTSELMSRVQEVQSVVSNFGEVAASAEATGFLGKLVAFFDSIANFFNRIFGSL